MESPGSFRRTAPSERWDPVQTGPFFKRGTAREKAAAFLVLSCRGQYNKAALYKTLHITIPEDLDYTDVFEPILNQYAASHELTMVKTTNMGSLFRLTYNLTLKTAEKEKELIDRLRCRNGNLEISISAQETLIGEL